MDTYENFKKFQDGKQRVLDKNYDKYAKDMINKLKKEYQKASKDIELDIRRWYADMEAIKKANPEFRFSELKQLEDLNKQIDLILDALNKAEVEIMENGMKKLFVTDYIDFNELNQKYFDMDLHTPNPEFNQLPQVQRLESLLNSGTSSISERTIEYAKKVADKTIAQALSNQVLNKVVDEFELSWFYDGTAGRWFNVRVEERMMKLGISLKDEIRKGVIKGDGLSGLVNKLENELEISYRHATTMVRTELATIENEAVIHNAKKLGFDALEFATMKDDRVCMKCREMEGKVIPLDARGADFVVHPNCRCVLVETIVDEKGKAIHSSYEQSGEADQYFDKKQEEWLKEQEENKRKLKEYTERLAKERKNKKKFTTDFKQ